MTEIAATASGISGVLYALGTTTATEIMTAIGIMTATEIAATTGGRWMIYTGEGIAMTMTTGERSAAFGERGLEKRAIAGTGEGAAIATTEIGRVEPAFPIPR